jgi:plastocyanin
MAIRHIYLRIEAIDDYSTVEPDDKAVMPTQYKRDGMHNMGHMMGMIPQAERDARAMRAVVYREYLDADYLVPRTSKIVLPDINEPLWDRRVPGTVIWAVVGQTLKIHVFNADNRPHSFHVHGLEYGIDSDGAWPLGVTSHDGRRSDEICPGRDWTYTFEIGAGSVGAWPFHDHSSHASHTSIKLGLFGAVIVRERAFRQRIPSPLPAHFAQLVLDKLPPSIPGAAPLRNRLRPVEENLVLDHHEMVREQILRAQKLFQWPWPGDERRLHVPVFFHEMMNDVAAPVFASGDMEENGAGVFAHTFEDAGSFGYFCEYHPMMTGTVEVVAGGPAAASVNILDAPAMGFYPETIQVAPGGVVTWTNLSMQHHTVTSNDGAAMATHCINGRGFVGNSPTIVARTGQEIVWYVFNLDFGHGWHNFHPHDQRWSLAGENLDIRSMGPAESFTVKTEAPAVLLLDPGLKAIQEHPPGSATKHRIMGDFMFHCHVHHHMMNGMIGVVRAYQDVWLTPEQETHVFHELGIQHYDPDNPIAAVEMNRCDKMGPGRWDELAVDPEVTFMHACLLPQSDKVLYWGYTRNDQSRLFDAASSSVAAPVNQPAALPGMDMDSSDLWSAAHAYLSDGRIVAHGGCTGPGLNIEAFRSFEFDPATEQWSHTGDSAEARFYSTTITLDDGRLMTLYGSASKSLELYDGGTGAWTPLIPMPVSMNHHVWYPWTQLLPDGRLFIAGPHDPTHRFDWNPVAGIDSFPMISGNRSTGGERGTSFMLTLRPPDYRPVIVVAGGDPVPARKTAEIIDLADAVPAWASLPDLNHPRPEQVNSVLLPDGHVLVAGGANVPGSGGPAELLDGNDPMAGWQLGPFMSRHRGYHSAAILLADGSVLFGGDPNSGFFERYYPGYYDEPRPSIDAAPAAVAYGATFSIDSPEAPDVAEVILMRPGAVTHGFNMTQRAIECAITGGSATSIEADAPPDGNVAAPGWYLLFVVNGTRIPSVGRWIQLGP